MKKVRYGIGDWQNDQARLDHYNEWLMDFSKPIGATYPGFPEEKTVQPAPVLEVTLAVKSKRSYNNYSEDLKGNYIMSKVTKLSQATEIVKTAKSKQQALADIQNALGVSKSNAFVYFTKASKILGTEKAPKVTKTVKASTGTVTEITPAKAAAKVAEIDKVIAGLKANGAKVASPFAGLTA